LLLPGRNRLRRAPRFYLPTLEPLEDRCLPSGTYVQTNLVADVPGFAAFTDRNLINPWGIAFGPGSPFWVSDNGTGLSTLYDGSGRPLSLGAAPAMTLPASPGGLPGTAAAPTGVVFNGGPGFVVSENGVSGPSLFLFATRDGTIAGWNPAVDGGRAVRAVDNPSGPGGGGGAVYTGLALAANASGTFLYAANFRAGTVDVFDRDFHAVHPSGSFTDPAIPAGFAPFGIQNIGGKLFVTYARQDAARYEAVAGPGSGFVDVFDTRGHLLRRLASEGPLDAPWGLALAPAHFGAFGHALLVGNFGDGRINAFDPVSGRFLGSLQDASGRPVTIPGLWGLEFGDGSIGAAGTLFFTAGGRDERHGLFGNLQTPESLATAPVGGARGGTYQKAGGPGEAVQDDGKDTYPIPPAGGPAFRGEVAKPVGQLPVVLPFKDLPVAALPASHSGPVLPPAPAALPVSAAGDYGPNSVAAAADVGAHSALGDPLTKADQPVEPGRAPALDLLTDVSLYLDAVESGAGADSQAAVAVPPLADPFGPSADVPPMPSPPHGGGGPHREAGPATAETLPAGNPPGGIAGLGAIAVPARAPKARESRFARVALPLVAWLLAAGVPLAWLCQQAAGRVSRKRDRGAFLLS
jgi:uncharacterized protein (TIGR03118 family)